MYINISKFQYLIKCGGEFVIILYFKIWRKLSTKIETIIIFSEKMDIIIEIIII